MRTAPRRGLIVGGASRRDSGWIRGEYDCGSEAGDASNGVALVRGETVEVVFAELTVAEQGGKDERQDEVPKLEVAVDLAAAVTKPAFQGP